jgi:hypothetical protein
MAFGKIGETLSALELLDLVNADLEKVEREIGLESVASVEAINYINRYYKPAENTSAPHPGAHFRPHAGTNPMLIRMAAWWR